MMDTKKLVPLLAGAVFLAQADAQSIDNWRNGSAELVWRNAGNELCWRDASWTPATAAAGCDGAIVAPRASAPPPAPAAPAAAAAPAAPAPAAAPVTAAPAPAAAAPAPPVAAKVTYATETFFDFDKSVLKPEGRAKLDELVDKVKGIDLEVVIAVGHTDWTGTDTYNQGLSVRRAEAVKAYLVSRGIEKDRVYTEGKGERQPVADNRTREGRAKNRRVEVEVVGGRTAR